VTNTAGIRVSNKLVDFSGGNHMILDRSMIHGQDDPTFNQTSEVQGGVNFNGSYLAVIDSWVYNTFCANAPTGATCVDSQGVSGGTGPYAQKAQKILNNLVASSGESWFWGGGQQAHLTNASNPDGVSTDIEVRKTSASNRSPGCSRFVAVLARAISGIPRTWARQRPPIGRYGKPTLSRIAGPVGRAISSVMPIW